MSDAAPTAGTQAEPTKISKAMLKGLYDWMREPDFAEEFSLADLADWVNRRPIAIAARLAGETVPAPSEGDGPTAAGDGAG